MEGTHPMTENPKPGDTPPAGSTCRETMGYRTACGRKAKIYGVLRDYSGAALGVPGKTERALHGRPVVNEADAEIVPLCGMHANMHAKRKADADRRETDRLQRQQERKALARRVSLATNLASMLSEAVAGISFSPSSDGRSVVLGTDAAAALLTRVAALPAAP